MSSQTPVFCLLSPVGGEFSLVDVCEDGSRGDILLKEGAGEIFFGDNDGRLGSLGTDEKGLPPIEGERSCVGLGEIGTFQMKASSGTSSSSSSHSASLSLTVFRFASCHDCLLELIDGDGRTSIFRELFLDSVRVADCTCVLEGEGERDERWGAARPVLVSDGADGEEKPLLSCFPGAAS